MIRIDATDNKTRDWLFDHLDSLPDSAVITITREEMEKRLYLATKEGVEGVRATLNGEPKIPDADLDEMGLYSRAMHGIRQELTPAQATRLITDLVGAIGWKHGKYGDITAPNPANTDRLQRVIATVANFVHDGNLTPAQQEAFASYIDGALGGEIAGDSNGVAELTALVSADIAAEHGLGAA